MPRVTVTRSLWFPTCAGSRGVLPNREARVALTPRLQSYTGRVQKPLATDAVGSPESGCALYVGEEAFGVWFPLRASVLETDIDVCRYWKYSPYAMS